MPLHSVNFLGRNEWEGSFPASMASLSLAEASFQASCLELKYPVGITILPPVPTHPIRSLSPLLLCWDKRLTADHPAPKDLVMMHRDVRLLGEIPNYSDGHTPITVDGGVSQPEVSRRWWGRWI